MDIVSATLDRIDRDGIRPRTFNQTKRKQGVQVHPRPERRVSLHAASEGQTGRSDRRGVQRPGGFRDFITACETPSYLRCSF